MQPIRVGIIGCGNIARYHLDGYQHAGAEVACVSDVNETQAQKFATQAGCDYVTDYHQLLARPDLAAVSLCLPNHLHYEAILQALPTGKAILCEKPLAINRDEAASIARQVLEKKSVFMMCCMKRNHSTSKRFHALAQAIPHIYGGRVQVFHAFPPTHVRQPTEAIGAKAAEILLAQIDRSTPQTPIQTVLLDGELVTGRST